MIGKSYTKPSDTILEKVLNNSASSEETKIVTNWLRSEEGISWLSHRMDQDESLINLGEEQQWVDHEIPSSDMFKEIQSKIRKRRWITYIIRTAAILIPFVLVLTMFLKVNDTIDLFATAKTLEYTVPKGEKMYIVFPDGSSAVLNSESTVTYPDRFAYGSRDITLNGEGWFEITSNKNRPFNISISDITVKVVGTSFNISSYSKDSESIITLEKGTIELSSTYFKPIKLEPKDQLIYNKEKKHYVLKRNVNVKTSKCWIQTELNFKATPLSEVIDELSALFHVKFRVIDQEAYKYTFNININVMDLPQILEELEKITPLRFKKNGNTIDVLKNP